MFARNKGKRIRREATESKEVIFTWLRPGERSSNQVDLRYAIGSKWSRKEKRSIACYRHSQQKRREEDSHKTMTNHLLETVLLERYKRTIMRALERNLKKMSTKGKRGLLERGRASRTGRKRKKWQCKRVTRNERAFEIRTRRTS